SFNGQLYAFDKQSGATVWEFQPALSTQNHLGLTNADGSFNVNPLIPMYDYSLVSADRLYMGEVFQLGSIVSSPLIHENEVYFTSTDSSLYALEGATLAVSQLNLDTLENDTIAEIQLVFSVSGGEYDSVTVAIKDNRADVRNAVMFDPVNFKPNSGK